ncbi:MAG: Nif3-like dinuclear metal center hexameric protein [Pseudomonadota bacterium]
MVEQKQLSAYLHDLLQVDMFSDFCPNGLQVQGKNGIDKIITGVTACRALLEVAVQKKADAVLVHHGYFWKNDEPTITGIQYHRLRLLLQHDINLFAYHLPLDAHATYGNNVALAKLLNIAIQDDMNLPYGTGVGLIGKLPTPVHAIDFARVIARKLGREPLVVSPNQQKISRIAWCTGGAQSEIIRAAECGVDAYLTGECSEQTFHLARELGVHFFAAGHHATERYGVQCLGEHLADKFDIDCEFIDIDNPM